MNNKDTARLLGQMDTLNTKIGVLKLKMIDLEMVSVALQKKQKVMTEMQKGPGNSVDLGAIDSMFSDSAAKEIGLISVYLSAVNVCLLLVVVLSGALYMKLDSFERNY